MDGAVTLSYNYTAVATADVPEPTALLLAATTTGLVGANRRWRAGECGVARNTTPEPGRSNLGSQRGSVLAPIKLLSTTHAACRPSRMAQARRLWPGACRLPQRPFPRCTLR